MNEERRSDGIQFATGLVAIALAILNTTQARAATLGCVGQVAQVDADLQHHIIALTEDVGSVRRTCQGHADITAQHIFFTCDGASYRLERGTGILARQISGQWHDWATCKRLRDVL
jgi:hypothetical protein